MIVYATNAEANPMAYGKPGIRVVLQTDGAAGKLYFHDEVGNIILATNISSGAEGFRTPSGTYKVYYKKKYHMSTKYPEDNGINNMDYSLFFRGGFAIHQGNPRSSSHGCIHVHPDDANYLYDIARSGTRVVIVRHDFRPTTVKATITKTQKNKFQRDMTRLAEALRIF